MTRKTLALNLAEWGSADGRKILRSQWSTALPGTEWLLGHGGERGDPARVTTSSEQES